MSYRTVAYRATTSDAAALFGAAGRSILVTDISATCVDSPSVDVELSIGFRATGSTTTTWQIYQDTITAGETWYNDIPIALREGDTLRIQKGSDGSLVDLLIVYREFTV